MGTSHSGVTTGPGDFRLMAHLLASAIEEADTGPVKEALAGAAHRLGEIVGQEVRSRLDPGAGFERQIAVVEEVLRSYGFEPDRDREQVRLANCPFQALAQEHMILVCGANLAFVDGLVLALQAAEVEVMLDPERGRCCVVIGAVGGSPQYRGG